MKKVLLCMLGAMALSGCAATGNGQSPFSNLTSGIGEAFKSESDSTKFSNHISAGQVDQALTLALEEADFDEEKGTLDDQLWAMQVATIYRMQGDYSRSNQFFDLIEDVMYAEDTENVVESTGETITSSLTNDTYLDYEQAVYDSIMVNTYKAMNFTATSDMENARVEWNRSDDRQRRAADFFAARINEKKEAQEKAAEEEKAKAAEESEKTENGAGEQSEESIDKSLSEAEKILAQEGIDMSGWSAYEGYINPFSTFMHGLFFMLTAQDTADVGKAVDSFTRVSGITNTAVANETLSLAQNILSGETQLKNVKNTWVIFEEGEMAKLDEFRIDLPVFLVSSNVNYVGMALPKLVEQPDHFGGFLVNGVSSEVVADMDKIIKAEFKEEFPMILTREITRTIVKTVAQKQVNDNNAYLGFAAGILQAATTEADTRTWSTLPKSFQGLMLENGGQTSIQIDSAGFAQPLSVDIDPNKNNIVYVKAINPVIAPSVEVISL